MEVEAIGTKIVDVIQTVAPTVPVALSEAETNDFPYCVYSQEVTPRRTKDGIYRFDADTTITVYSNSFSEADGIADDIVDAMEDEMTGVYHSAFRSRGKTRSQGIWAIQLNYHITQSV